VALVLFAVGAFAASLMVSSEDVASGSDDVLRCAERVDVDFATQYSSASQDWTVETVDLAFSDGETATDGCDGFAVTVVLSVDGGSDVTLEGTVEGAGASLAPPGEILVSGVTNASVLVEGLVIDGPTPTTGT
jgi:hypothetical protein